MAPGSSAGFDTIIIGAGSAGCVLANRLSARSGNRVLLIEAGPDYPPGSEPDEIRDVYPYFAANNWNHLWPDLKVWLAPVAEGANRLPSPRAYRQARVVGGGSTINGILANRGTPDDYDGWARDGATGWDWASVLPYFIRLERDLDFGGPLHGAAGPIPVSRVLEIDWPGFSRAIGKGLSELGLHDIGDQNACFDDGWFPLATSTDRRQRTSAAMAYLDATVRARPNLTIRPGTAVHRIVMEGGSAVGVDIAGEVVRAREVIVSAGALQTPVFLLRAGIGPAGDLREARLPVIADLPGVGRNLQEHPALTVSTFLARGARQGRTMRRHAHVGARYSSGLPGMPANDMYLVVLAKSAWHPVGRRIGSLFTWINKPFSRGMVRLDPTDPAGSPRIAFQLLSDERDLVRMKAAFRFLGAVLTTRAVHDVASDPAVSTHGALAQIVRDRSAVNWMLTMVPAMLMDGPAPLRRRVLDFLVAQAKRPQDILADDALLEETVRRCTIGGWHPSGTCRMGPREDRGAVVDPHTGRVYGVGGLSVVDASIMPSVPRANTNIPTIMLAEKMADTILAR